MSFVTVTNLMTSEIEVKHSKFVSFLMPYSQFKEQMALLRNDHTKARHFVYAYRFVNEHEQIVENQSDDGEPKGSSGKPSLAVIAGKGLVNVALITVRYFGGTKLGVGGLVRAYGDSANEVIANSILIPFNILEEIGVEIAYGFFAKFEHMLEEWEPQLMRKEFIAANVQCHFSLPREKVAIFREQFSEIKDLQFLE